MDHTVNIFRIAVGELYTVLRMRMDDIATQIVDCLHGIVARHHDKVGGIKVDRDAGRIQRIEELRQHGGRLRPCLDGKMRTDAVGITGKLTACLLHDLISVMIFIGRHHADVRRHDIRFKILCHIHNALGLLDKLRIEHGIAETASEIAANSGEYHPVVLHKMQKLAAFLLAEAFGGMRTARAVHLNAFDADRRRLFDGFHGIATERIHNRSDRKIVHNRKSSFGSQNSILF